MSTTKKVTGKKEESEVSKSYTLYTDGSWSKSTRKCGSAMELYSPSGELLSTLLMVSHKDTSGRGLTGEINAVKLGLVHFSLLPKGSLKKCSTIVIKHDFSELDPELGHKVKNSLMQEYHSWLKSFKEQHPNLKILFSKVPAHKGNQKNNKVDKLAKLAANIKTK